MIDVAAPQAEESTIPAVWRALQSAPDAFATPADLPHDGAFLHARVPGTFAGALRDAGAFDLMKPPELDDIDVWYCTDIAGEGRYHLHFDGLATQAEVWLDDACVLRSDSMFVEHDVEVTLTGTHRLSIAFRALGPILAAPSKRARWRPRNIAPQGLRNVRATLLGRMPGWCPPVHAVGPYRPISLAPVDKTPVLRDLRIHADFDGRAGQLDVSFAFEGASKDALVLTCAGRTTALSREADGRVSGHLTLANIAPWWPHTHGAPALHDIRIDCGVATLYSDRIGFRRIERDDDADRRGFALRVNGERVFCRGALWTTPDLVDLPCAEGDYRPLLTLMRDAHMNMVRVGGTMTYESTAFFRICDELGLLVWQDFMFSNFDYPAAQNGFVAKVEIEARQLLARLQGRASLAVLCGGSEIAQQAAMLGMPPSLWSNRLFDEVLPHLATDARPDPIWLPNTPWGQPLPFEPAQGVCHYYGVSAYMRPSRDARDARVRFAAECLGFAHVPDSPTFELVADEAGIAQPCWGERLDHDVGATWFFEDVRNHYLTELYGLDPQALRRQDPDRYIAMSRAVTAELAEDVFASFRRNGSATAGALVWFLRDVAPGAGFGIVDYDGRPKSTWYALRRASRPLQVLLTDEGLNGIHVHLINERAFARDVTLHLACLRDGAVPVMKAERHMTLAPRQTTSLPAVDLWGAFFDTAYAYRFGPPSHDVTLASLTDDGTQEILSEAFHFPLGRRTVMQDPGLAVELRRDAEGWFLAMASQFLAQSVHILSEHFLGDDSWFHLAPGRERMIRLRPRRPDIRPSGLVGAINSASFLPFGDVA